MHITYVIGLVLLLILRTHQSEQKRDREFTNLKTLNRIFYDVEDETVHALKLGLKPNVSMDCIESLKEFKKGLEEKKVWAVRMIDSFGKIPNGMTGGSLNSLGDYDECVNTKATDKFKGQYCLLNIGPADSFPISNLIGEVKSKWNAEADKIKNLMPLTTSICLPSTCSTRDTEYLIAKVQKSMHIEMLKIKLRYCLEEEAYRLPISKKIIMAIILALILLECFATLFDLILKASHKNDNFKTSLSTRRKILLCFSYYSNLIRLLKKDDNPDSVKIFHGMKFMTMLWIIFGHNSLYYLRFSSQTKKIEALMGLLSSQIMWNCFISVDTFFYISGFLVSYSYIKSNMPSINFFVFVTYRYIRLLSSTFFLYGCILFVENLGRGPYWKEIFNKNTRDCEKFWWKNVLCINNLYESEYQCLPWTWYIAADMQFYTGSYFILLIFKKNPRKAVSILIYLAVAGIIFIAGNTYYYDLPPVSLFLNSNVRLLSFYAKKIHFFPLNHVTTYSIGMIVGYFIASKKRINMTKAKIFIGSFSSYLIAIGIVFITYIWNNGHYPTLLESVLYCSLYRFFWSIMLSWVIYISLNNRDLVWTILSWDGFVVLGRLTFTAYLLNPVVLYAMFGNFRHHMAVDKILIDSLSVSCTVLTFVFSFFICLMCESPLTALLSLLFSSKRKKEELRKTDEVFQ